MSESNRVQDLPPVVETQEPAAPSAPAVEGGALGNMAGRLPPGVLQRKIQRRALQRKEGASGGAAHPGGDRGAAPGAAINEAARDAGQPVDGGIRGRMEAATGADLG